MSDKYEAVFIIRDQETKRLAIARIENCHIPESSEDLTYEVRVRPYRRNRSADQNALYWKWITIYAAEVGTTKDDLHLEMKRKHLVPILIRDDPGYAEMVAAVKEVRTSGNVRAANRLKKHILVMTSTTDLNTKQMTEYMDEVKNEAAGLGIVLQSLEDMIASERKE